MELIKSSKNIILGQDYNVRYGNSVLTLEIGFMTEGSPLPPVYSLVTPELNQTVLPTGVHKILFTVPSLDTQVCEWQIKNLSETLSNKESDDVNDIHYYVISVDTPFAQARFIRENNINPKIHFLSDYADHRFMSDTGLRIIELNVFTRAIIECDENNRVLSVTIPEEITQVP